MSPRISRRAVVGVAVAAGASAACPTARASARRRKLDFSNAADLLYAEMKMTSDLRDHHEVIIWMRGISYAIFDDGKTIEPMFGVGSIAFTRSFRVDDVTYRSMTNFVICYTDLDGRTVLEQWYNPWLKRNVKVVNYASTLHTVVKPSPSINHDAKLRVEWMVNGNDVTRWIDGVIVKPNPITPDKWPKASVGATYYKNQSSQTLARLDELEESATTSVDAVSFGQRHGPWYPWQEMGTAPGRTYRRDMTKKVARLLDVPGPIPRYATEHFPQYMSAPREWTGAYVDPETLWSQTMPAEIVEGSAK